MTEWEVFIRDKEILISLLLSITSMLIWAGFRRYKGEKPINLYVFLVAFSWSLPLIMLSHDGVLRYLKHVMRISDLEKMFVELGIFLVVVIWLNALPLLINLLIIFYEKIRYKKMINPEAHILVFGLSWAAYLFWYVTLSNWTS